MRRALCAFVLLLAGAIRADGAITYQISFDDPAGDFTPYLALLESHALAAGARWGQFLAGDASIEVVIRADSTIPFGSGGSLTSNFVRNNGSFDVFEQGMMAEIRTGVDPNGEAPDVEIRLSVPYVRDELWYDPEPSVRSAIVDGNRTDAMSTFLHEFAHALGYSGWLNPTTGEYPGNFQSTFDEQISFDGENFYFNGPRASALNGGPIPITFANGGHIANLSPRPGEELALDLMNGLFFYRGTRYLVSPLNLAMLADTGGPVEYVAGDFNLDGVADAADYVVWRDRSSGGAPLKESAYGVWAGEFGAAAGAGEAAATPEPISTALATLCAVWVTTIRRRREA